MNSQLIKFPVKSFRKVADSELLSSDDDSKATIYTAIVDVRDLPDLEGWRDINPRDPNINSAVSNKIRGTLDESPETFILKNRGLTILVDKADFNNQTNQLSLELEDQKLHGLLDGGHTYEVIKDFISSLSEEDNKELTALVKIEVIEGIKDKEVAIDIVAARNTSAQVKEQSLENLKGHFELIKEVLKGKDYSDKISFKETEYDEDSNRKTIDIREILSYLICFDAEKYNNEVHPIIAYSQKNSVVKLYSEDQKRLVKYIELLPIILELHDRIYKSLPQAYNDKTKGKFGGLAGVKYTGNKTRMTSTHLAFINADSDYRIPSAFIYPVLAAFRSAVQVEGNKATWKTNPLTLLDELIENLAQLVGKQAVEFRHPTKLGKDSATLYICYNAVERDLLIRNIK